MTKEKITTRTQSRQKKIQIACKIIDYMISILLCNKTALDKVPIKSWELVAHNSQTLLKKVGGVENCSQRYMYEPHI